MYRKLSKLFFLVIMTVCIADLSAATLKGQVINKDNKPIPGLTLSLVNTTEGRSAPVTTDGYGNFIISNIPQTNNSFYLEIYWGKQLIYRKKITVSPNLMVIRL